MDIILMIQRKFDTREEEISWPVYTEVGTSFISHLHCQGIAYICLESIHL